MKESKKEALMQSIFSMIGIIACLFIKPMVVLSNVVKWVMFVFLILLLIDGLRRLFKRISPTTMGKING